MEKVYIAIAYGDCKDVVQYANSIEQAQMLIEKVMPKLKTGYKYITIK